LIIGRKPVPLHAEQISSTTSDLIGFIMLATPATLPEIDPFSYKLRNQLQGVTLLLKVKLNFDLLSLPAIGSV
jgi:hypothetical protein